MRKTFLNSQPVHLLLLACLVGSGAGSVLADTTLADTAPRFYQHLILPAPEKSAHRIETVGWSIRGHPALSLEPPIDWSADPHGDANWRYQLNAMYPLAPAFLLLEQNYSAEHHGFVHAVFRDWFDFHIAQDNDHQYRWNDMATGIRGAYLAQLIHLERTRGDGSELDWMLEAARQHLEALADPEQLAPHNHAVYQLVGIAALCEVVELPDCSEALDYARTEFGRIFATQFNAEGMHLEHSPAYHGIAVRVFDNISSVGLLELSDEHQLWLERARENLQYLIHPDGGFAEVGDTESGQSAKLGRYHPQADWLISGGRRGELPHRGARVFPLAGLVSIRSGGPALDTYLYFTVAHHSRAHKHLDTGSFEWSDRGRRVLTDSGKWGYDAGPERTYVESVAAHNSVQTEGVRLSPGDVPAVQAPLVVSEIDGAYVILTRLPAPRLLLDGNHTRVLVLRPGAWLVVADVLEDLFPSSHTQWFQLQREVEVEQTDSGFVFDVGDSGRMQVLPLLDNDRSILARGEAPELLGWHSPRYRQFVPAAQIGFQGEGRLVNFATLFRWVDDDGQTLRPRGAFDGRTLDLCWQDGDGISGVEISGLDGDLTVRRCGESS